MPPTTRELTLRRAELADDLDEIREKESALEDEAAEARADGRDGRADEILEELSAARDRRENLEVALPKLEERLEAARARDRRESAERRAEELADRIEKDAEWSKRLAEVGLEKLEAAIEEIEHAVQLHVEAERLSAEHHLVATLVDGIDVGETPKVPPLGGERQRVAELRGKLKHLLRHYDGATRQAGDFRSRLNSLGAGIGRPTYSRAHAGFTQLTEETREVVRRPYAEGLKAMYEGLGQDQKYVSDPPSPRG